MSQRAAGMRMKAARGVRVASRARQAMQRRQAAQAGGVR